MPQMVDVPDVEGLAKQEAQRRVEALELELLVVDREHDLELPKGSVIEQSPATGDELEEGSALEVVLSLGPPKVKLPDLTGMPLEKAEQELISDDLALGSVTKEFSLEEEGTVLEQSPADGRLVVGSEVALVVSKGPEPLEVPDVSGLRAERAASKIESAGFKPVLVDAYSDEVKEGLVISTSPGPLEIADEGSNVDVYVSIGPEFEKIRMPDVRGMTANAAKAELEAEGLRVVVRRPCGTSSATVVETDPTPGSKITEGSQVALFLC